MYSEKKANYTGLILVAAGTAAVGSVLSAIYLRLNGVVPSVYLCALAAVTFGALAGFVSGKMIAFLKIRTPALAIAAVIVGCLGFTYFKWALYLANDYNAVFGDNLGEDGADEVLTGFWLVGDLFGDENGNIRPNSELSEIIRDMKEPPAYKFLDDEKCIYLFGTSLTEELKDELSGISFYELFGFEETLGVSDASAIRSIREITDNSLYYYYADREKNNGKYPTAVYYMARPGRMLSIIGLINGEGRWSYVGNGSGGNAMDVKGPLLCVVWIAELFFICAPAVAVASVRARRPFIEFENKWAELYKGYNLLLEDGEVFRNDKNYLKNYPETLLTALSLNGIAGGPAYFQADIYHSSGFEENYISIKRMSYNAKSKNYNESVFIRSIPVSRDFLLRLFAHCGAVPPFGGSEFSTGAAPRNTLGASGLYAFDEANQPAGAVSPEMEAVSPYTGAVSPEMEAVSPYTGAAGVPAYGNPAPGQYDIMEETVDLNALYNLKNAETAAEPNENAEKKGGGSDFDDLLL